MAAQLYEAAQRQEVDDSITPIHEEPGSIDDSVDERLKTYNLLSLGCPMLFTYFLMSC